MALPPYVIVRKNALAMEQLLGATRWGMPRREALSFSSAQDADDWIRASRKLTPAMFAHPEWTVSVENMPDEDKTASNARVMSDYDPLDASA